MMVAEAQDKVFASLIWHRTYYSHHRMTCSIKKRMDDWSWQERYSWNAFLPVPRLFPAFELRLLSGNCITAAPTNARLKTEGLLYVAYVCPVFYLYTIIQYIQNGPQVQIECGRIYSPKSLKCCFCQFHFLKLAISKKYIVKTCEFYLHWCNFHQCKISDFDIIGK